MLKLLLACLLLLSERSFAQDECRSAFLEKAIWRVNLFAENFKIAKRDETFLLEVDNHFVLTGSKDQLPDVCHTYYLSNPKVLPLSTTVLHFFELLEKEKAISAFPQKKYISSQKFHHVEDIGPNPDIERILMLKVDLLIGEPYFFQSAGPYARTLDVGLRILPLRDYQERHPLGRAEWLILFAHLYPELELLAAAQSLYAEIVGQYQKIESSVANLPLKKVLVGSLLQGQWYSPKDKSDFNDLLAAARAENILQSSTGLVPLEEVIEKSTQADLWLSQSVWDSSRGAIKQDERHAFILAQLPKVIGLVHHNQLAYPFWEEGAARPDLVLEEMVNFLHKGIGPSRYFKKIKGSQK